MLKNEKGSAMIVTIIVVIVITLLGFSLWNYSMGEVSFSAREVNRTKAHYLARSGAESVAQHLIDNYNSSLVTAIEDGTTVTSDPKLLGDGTFIVSVRMEDEEVYIESTGEVNGVTDDVTLVLEKAEVSFSAIFNNAIFSVGDIDISHTNARVYGDVESNGAITGVPDSGEAHDYSTRYFPTPIMPDNSDLVQLDDIFINENNAEMTISWNDYPNGIYIENVTVNPSASLIFDVPEGEELIVKVDKYTNKGITEVTGGGIVMLFITHSAELRTPNAMSPESLMVIMDEDTVATLQANGEFNGYIYGPTATTIMQSKWSTVNGAIITGGMYGNVSQARFIGTVAHAIREKLDMSTLGEYIPVTEKFQKSRWGN